MKILICDDEPLAIDRLSRLVSQLGHEVVATAQDGVAVMALVEQFRPDVLLLDIQMPELDGLSCAKQLANLSFKPAIIFCTAYDQHALAAFQAQAQAYLLKPIAKAELQQALEHIVQPNQAQLSQLKHAESSQLPQTLSLQRQFITARSHRGVELIPIERIYYFLADQKYVSVRHDQGLVLIDETLKELESEFSQNFIRIHRNALVSIQDLDGLETLGAGQYQVRFRKIDDKLAVSRRHLPVLREKLNRL
ncbi:LytTR family DNA-binding domain-containing protein [Acinetobacter sp. MD2(2019)]|uniref:LytR/AlgR family response regulator transcription factor n=1 Tax=Acinetobacter sp. MD2(2019) TaxID=2605273 RepID=UPI002D1E7F4B|nr:LytTR family DNA-binding domain-containing protein [Acinetobacter sp. MD2(2019)]MEB3754458.1 response regulator transcription factor [Acinetobacter sp. MD2(2019)]